MYVRIWRFRPRLETVQQFEIAYGPQGDWAKLFALSQGFLATELIKSINDSSEYLTIDRWVDEQSWKKFKEHYHQEYSDLDDKCSMLTIEESEIGTYIDLPL